MRVNEESKSKTFADAMSEQLGGDAVELAAQTGRGKTRARSYDYVISGAGSAGCVVARRLLDGTNATVLLLEAGGSDEGADSISNPPQWGENIGSRYDWAYRYEPSPQVCDRSIPLSLGKLLGGSGSINGMRIADASIMPMILTGPTNAPSVMIGEFASRLLVRS